MDPDTLEEIVVNEQERAKRDQTVAAVATCGESK